jgi:Fe-S cluster assembly ATPase SufC
MLDDLPLVPVVVLEPADVLLFEIEKGLDPNSITDVREKLEAFFPGYRILVMSGMHLKAILKHDDSRIDTLDVGSLTLE